MLKLYSSPYKLKKKWEALYASTNELTPFQAYTAHVCYYKVYSLKGTRRKYAPIFAYHIEGNAQCIMPLLINKKEKILRNFSSFGPIDYYNVIASTYGAKYIQTVLRELFALFKDYTIVFENIPDSSALYMILKSNKIYKEICVHIPLAQYSNVEEYVQSLSKHQRQNVRTAYNKLARNDISFRLEVYGEYNPMPRMIRKCCDRMYESRYEYKFGNAYAHPFQRLIMRWLHRLQDPLNKIIASTNDNRTFVLLFNDNPVAYLSGFFNQDKSKFYVPRLTCHVDYLSYDPGILLVFEVIKVLKKQNVVCIDLTRGDEPYKYAMGGVEHYNYTISGKANNVLVTI